MKKNIAKIWGHSVKGDCDDIEKNLGENVVSKGNALSYEYINEEKLLEK